MQRAKKCQEIPRNATKCKEIPRDPMGGWLADPTNLRDTPLVPELTVADFPQRSNIGTVLKGPRGHIWYYS